ncbi:hypothetical protein, partial [Gluconobacter sp. GP1]|uniref:hypothetical protein n=1 Tax=Gluconobacter sp. GP1 TaxID=3046423 RepID=UPI00293E21FD
VENDLSITKFDTNEIKKLYKTLDKSWRLYNELPEGIIGELKCSVNNFDEQKIKYENFVKKFICSEKDVRGILQSNFYKLSNKYIDNSISSINTHIEDLQGRINNLKEKNMDAIDLENSVVMIREQKLRVGENTPEIEEDISTFNDKANECLKIIISITYNIEKIRDIMGKHLIIWN